jgi:hypothetical protein
MSYAANSRTTRPVIADFFSIFPTTTRPAYLGQVRHMGAAARLRINSLDLQDSHATTALPIEHRPIELHSALVEGIHACDAFGEA